MLARYRCALVYAALLSTGVMTAAVAQTDLTVHFRLVNAGDRPLPQTTARLVLGSANGWQQPAAGQVLQTNAAGEAQLTFANAIEYRTHKRPTNFVDSLFSRAEPTDHVQAAVELEYAGRQRLIVVKLYRFRSDASVLMDGFEVYTPDAVGGFTVKGAKVNGYDWRIPEPDGAYSGHPGFELQEFALAPVTGVNNVAARQWSLRLVFRRLADPVRR